MRMKSNKPIIAGFQTSDRSCNTETLSTVPDFGQASAKNTARLRLEIVLQHFGTTITLEIVSPVKNRRFGPAPTSRVNGNLARSTGADITDAPDKLLAALMRSIHADGDGISNPFSALR